MGLVLGLVPLTVVVVAIVVLVSRALGNRKGQPTDGNDVVAYLILAIAMIVAGFALARLAATAFPGDRFVFDPADELATSLASLVVSVPFLIYFWNRQAGRRQTYPNSAGWSVYLVIIEVVFTIALAVAAVSFLNGFFDRFESVEWTGLLVFGAIAGFHEVAARRSPPEGTAGELRRVVGSAIGLITGAIGLTGLLGVGLYQWMYNSLTDGLRSPEFTPWAAIAVVGAVIWAYRWLTAWNQPPDVPRQVWSVVTTLGGLFMAVGGAIALAVLTVVFWFSSTAPADQHFQGAPIALAVATVGLLIWLLHRPGLGPDRGDALRSYEYLASGAGLAVASGSAVALTILAFSRRAIVGGDSGDVLGVSIILIATLTLWWYFTGRHRAGSPAEELTAWPRRFYHLAAGIIFGLIAAGSLIAVLFNLLRRALGDAPGSLLEPAAALIFTALPAWYLLTNWAASRPPETEADGPVAKPFQVTVVCSHPGHLAVALHEAARLNVVYRADDLGVITDEMAPQISEAVGVDASIVWVDADGYRVTKLRTS